MFFDRASRAQQRTPLNEHIHFSRMLLRPIKLFVYTLDEWTAAAAAAAVHAATVPLIMWTVL